WLSQISVGSVMIAVISGIAGLLAVGTMVTLTVLLFDFSRPVMLVLGVLLGGAALVGTRIPEIQNLGGAQLILVASVAAQVLVAIGASAFGSVHVLLVALFSGALYVLIGSPSHRFLSACVLACTVWVEV